MMPDTINSISASVANSWIGKLFTGSEPKKANNSSQAEPKKEGPGLADRAWDSISSGGRYVWGGVKQAGSWTSYQAKYTAGFWNGKPVSQVTGGDVLATFAVAAAPYVTILGIAGCGPAEEAISEPDKISGVTTFSVQPYAGKEDLYSGAREFQYLGGDEVKIDIWFGIAQAGPLDQVQDLRLAFYFDPQGEAKLMKQKEDGCSPDVTGRIDTCTIDRCRAANAALGFKTDIDNNPMISATGDTTLEASMRVNSDAPLGWRDLIVTSKQLMPNGSLVENKYLSTIGSAYDVTSGSLGQDVSNSFAFEGTQFNTYGWTSPLLLNSSADMCNFSESQYAGLFSTESGYHLKAFSVMSSDYGATLNASLTGTLPSYVLSAEVCNVFGSGQTKTEVCSGGIGNDGKTIPAISIPGAKIMNRGDGKLYLSIPKGVWGFSGTLNGYGHVSTVVKAKDLQPILNSFYGTYIGLDLEAVR